MQSQLQGDTEKVILNNQFLMFFEAVITQNYSSV